MTRLDKGATVLAIGIAATGICVSNAAASDRGIFTAFRSADTAYVKWAASISSTDAALNDRRALALETTVITAQARIESQAASSANGRIARSLSLKALTTLLQATHYAETVAEGTIDFANCPVATAGLSPCQQAALARAGAARQPFINALTRYNLLRKQVTLYFTRAFKK